MYHEYQSQDGLQRKTGSRLGFDYIEQAQPQADSAYDVKAILDEYLSLLEQVSARFSKKEASKIKRAAGKMEMILAVKWLKERIK